MANLEFPKKQLLILTAICAAITFLAIVIGLISKNSNSTPTYIVETEQLDK